MGSITAALSGSSRSTEKDRHVKNTEDEQQRKARWVKTTQPSCRPRGQLTQTQESLSDHMNLGQK